MSTPVEIEEDAYAYERLLIHIYAAVLNEMIFNQYDTTFDEVHIVNGLISQQCFGCQFQASSQKDHDLCLMPFEQQISHFIDYAIENVDHEHITDYFNGLLEKSYRQQPISPTSPHARFINETWRKDVWIQTHDIKIALEQKMIDERNFQLHPFTPYPFGG